MSGEAETLSFLLETLKEEWRNYKNLKAGARNEFTQLKSALGELEAFLKDTAKIPEKSNLFTKKESEIRDLVYEVEDTIEFWMTKKAKNKGMLGRLQERCSTKMEQDVKRLREQKVQPILDVIRQQGFEVKKSNYGSSSSLQFQIPAEVKMNQDPREKQGVGTDECDNCTSTIGPRATRAREGGSAFEMDQSWGQDKIVDFQDEGKIIDILMDPNIKELDVISITGMAGIGKTTFARKIFENQDVVAKFPLRIWIHVSENFNSVEAFRYILTKLTLKPTVFTTEEELIASVYENLRKKEFLLVTDNVWKKEDWKKIKEILPKGNDVGMGKVLLTTREIEVAGEANIIRTPHQLNSLSTAASLKLLKLQVFDKLEHCHGELEEIGKVIAKNCGGVPLVILVIGGILKRIFTYARGIPDLKEEWLKVSTTVNELLEKDEQKMISRALEMSYKRLDYDMRICFLYSGLFPAEISVSTLTQLWIAEGFVKKGKESLEEKAEKILDTLIKMNLLKVAKKNLQQVKTCWVHDMIREFCRAKAMEKKLFGVIKRSIGVEVPDFFRLCFDSDPSEFLTKCPKEQGGKNVRSLLCFYEKSVKLQAVTLPDVCNFIRVLNCRSTKFPDFPEVKKLILLKHITLSIENLQVLPEDISELINLQTLIVETNLPAITVKANISKMIQLRRLKTKAAIFLDDKNWKVEACQNLQTFSRLSPQSCKPNLSKRAPNLKTLGVRGNLANLVQTMSWNDFPHLEKLKLMNDPDDKSKPSNPLVLTELDRFPHKLMSLTLAKTDLKWNVHMRLLAKIENLKVLMLKDNAFIGQVWVANEADHFPKLEFLLIDKSGLVKWNASESCFPKLRSLVIKNCKNLSEIPKSPSKSLESLEIDHVMNKSVVESAKKIAERQTKENQNAKWEIPFKLTIGPGCDQADLFSGTIKPKE